MYKREHIKGSICVLIYFYFGVQNFSRDVVDLAIRIQKYFSAALNSKGKNERLNVAPIGRNCHVYVWRRLILTKLVMNWNCCRGLAILNCLYICKSHACWVHNKLLNFKSYSLVKLDITLGSFVTNNSLVGIVCIISLWGETPQTSTLFLPELRKGIVVNYYYYFFFFSFSEIE